jgi:hypothetical protein
MKRASYREAVAWIAINDDAGATYALDAEHLRIVVTVILIADIFGKDPVEVATDVVKFRAAEAVRRATQTKGAI